ncbi:hypothetical protein AVEN_254668-1 [Araneus ventricosus]|uniref:Uncharacterized protein n=1 Tax=Araneus ventricosus TaxID=182803 RepID=A0A4Y2RDS5_ARAVE|nr:hypothetical protein AVEN_254668-1 [Araneus ventricosus]
MTPRDFSLWGYGKGHCFLCLLWRKQLKAENVLLSLATDMLQNVCREMGYRLEDTRVIRGSHVEHLQDTLKSQKTGTGMRMQIKRYGTNQSTALRSATPI